MAFISENHGHRPPFPTQKMDVKLKSTEETGKGLYGFVPLIGVNDGFTARGAQSCLLFQVCLKANSAFLWLLL